MRIELTSDERKIWEKAIDRWGSNHQIIMAVEESAEVIQALAHFQRGRSGINKVIEEFGDAFVCVGQVIHSECGDNHANTQEIMALVIERAFKKLRNKLAADNKNQGEGR